VNRWNKVGKKTINKEKRERSKNTNPTVLKSHAVEYEFSKQMHLPSGWTTGLLL